MQNTLEKGLKIHPLGTLVAIVACMIIFYVCNLIVTKFAKNNEEELAKEIKQRVEEVKINAQTGTNSEKSSQVKMDNVKVNEMDDNGMGRGEETKIKAAIEVATSPEAVKV